MARVFYLIPPADRTKLWTPVELPHEPSVHRMHWIAGAGRQVFLRRETSARKRNGRRRGFPDWRMLEYHMPADSRAVDKWKTMVVGDFTHLSHNFHPVNWDDDPEEELIAAAKEGVWHFDRVNGKWQSRQLTSEFAGEIRDGRLPQW